MSLAVGDLCTVVYADGGVRVALPIEVATSGQNGFLADFGNSGTGVPIRIRTVQEVAATVPESAHDPRLQRVVGTIVRDGSQVALFVPLGVIPESTPEPTPATTFFVVFADTAPVENSFAQYPHAYYRRTPEEFDYLRITVVGGGPVFTSISYQTGALDVAHIGGGYFREIVRQSPITRKLTTINFDEVGPSNFSTAEERLGAGQTYQVTYGNVRSRSALYIISRVDGDISVAEIPADPLNNSRSFQVTYEYFPVAVQRLRANLAEWDTLPPTIVYHLPLSPDALPGTINQIVPPGETDTAPMEFIVGDYPSAGAVASLIAERATDEGVREVRFFTAMATVGAQARVQELLDEVIGSLQASYGEIVHSITVAPGNDWLGALADSAADMPDA